MIPPANGAFSTRSVFAPALDAASAAAVPAQPAPHTSTSVSITRCSFEGRFNSAPDIGSDAAAAAPIVAVWMKFLREWLCVVFMSGGMDLKALGEVWSGCVGGLGRDGKSKAPV
jgi:hypothetical protein